MTMLTAPATDLGLTIKDEVFVRASLEHTFDSVLAQMGRLNETPDGKPFPIFPGPARGNAVDISSTSLWWLIKKLPGKACSLSVNTLYITAIEG